MKRKRGAPPGNQNALKHGFYSSAFKKRELEALDGTASSELSAEINLVRVATMRFLAALDASPQPVDLETQLSILRAINLGAHSINGMVRTHVMLARGGLNLAEILGALTSPASDEDQAATADPDQPR